MMNVLLFLLLTVTLQSPDLTFSKDFMMHKDIHSALKTDITESVVNVLRRYTEHGDFWNEGRNEFSSRDYPAFVSLFSGDAMILDDIKWTGKNIHYSEYAQTIYDKMQETGLRFKVKDVKITKIDIDETGFYVVDLRITKKLYSGLNKNDKTVELRSGRTVKVDMRVDLPDYLLSDARIQYIREYKSTSLFEIARMPMDYVVKKLSKNK